MAEAPANASVGGYNEEFVNTVEEDLQCAICQLPLKDPILTKCGHRFCRQCLDEYFKSLTLAGQRFICPVDRNNLFRYRDIFPDKATERKILSLFVKCPSEGCQWTGELRSKDSHLESCPLKVVSCTNENCQETLTRNNLQGHVTTTCLWRILRCNHCSLSHAACKTEAHELECKRKPINCPKNCGAVVPREELPAHGEKDCPLTVTSCPYAQMGCTTKVQRKEIDIHLQSAVGRHLDLTCVKLKSTQIQLNSTLSELKTSQETARKLGENVNALEKQLKLIEGKVTTFQSQLETTKKEREDRVETVEMLLVGETKNVKSLEKKLQLLQIQLNKMGEKQKIKDEDDLHTRFVMKINKFSQNCSEAKENKNTTISSTPFYTAKFGYKLKLLVYPNGDSSVRNTHLSVFIVVMKGEYDAILHWPFNKKIKLTLIDQQEDTGERKNVVFSIIPDDSLPNFAKPEAVENVGRGYPSFISHEELQTRRYLVDDTLFIQVEVGPP